MVFGNISKVQVAVFAFCVAVALTLSSPSSRAQEEFPLTAGRNVVIGTVSVDNDADYLYVTLETDGRNMREAHLYVLDEDPGRRLPPGRAPYRSEYVYYPQHCEFAIPLEERGIEYGDTVYIQMHVAVPGESAYGGDIITPGRGAWYGIIAWQAAAPAPSEPDMTWVDIPDSNADYPAQNCPAQVGFTGKMSRYPTTNAQYAKYLNDALASGDIEVDGDQVRGTTGEYAGEDYYRLDGPGSTAAGANNGGASRISHSDGVFTVDSGVEDHPVTYVSWYGATAFAEYYGWRLPTEWEWESVANYNDNRTYATGGSLKDGDVYLANDSGNDSHEFAEYGTTPVGHFGTFGYGMADMAGNVWDWTSTALVDRRVFRGGSWINDEDFSTVSYRLWLTPDYQLSSIGFRVCR